MSDENRNEPSAGAKVIMIAMAAPVVPKWFMDGHGCVRPTFANPDLPGKALNRLDPGYYDLDDEVMAYMTKTVRGGQAVYSFSSEMLVRIEHWRASTLVAALEAAPSRASKELSQ